MFTGRNVIETGAVKKMPYRVVSGGKVKAVRRDFEEAKAVARMEAMGSGFCVELEQAEAGNKWSLVEIVSHNGSEINLSSYEKMNDSLFGSLRQKNIFSDERFGSSSPSSPEPFIPKSPNRSFR